jgi:ParB family chromosome partitioning protein
MSLQERKLGRGLSALLGESKAANKPLKSVSIKANEGSLISSIPISRVIAGVYQPRRKFSQDDLRELADSIKENGLIQPILVRKSDDSGHYEIIAGERRYRAIKMLGLTSVPAIIKKINNHEALELALIENVQRSDLTIIEEAAGYKQLMDDFSYTQDQVAKKTGKGRSHIANLLRLLQLPELVKSMLDEKSLSFGHAKVIANSNNPESFARKIVEASVTVRDVEDMVRDEKIEKLKTNPVIVRQESTIKFVNSGEMTDIENKLSEVLESNVKISFNQFKNSGKLTIAFNDLAKIYSMLEKLEA